MKIMPPRGQPAIGSLAVALDQVAEGLSESFGRTVQILARYAFDIDAVQVKITIGGSPLDRVSVYPRQGFESNDELLHRVLQEATTKAGAYLREMRDPTEDFARTYCNLHWVDLPR